MKQPKYLGNITFQGSAQGGNFQEHHIQLPDLDRYRQRNKQQLIANYNQLERSGLQKLKLRQQRDDLEFAQELRLAKVHDDLLTDFLGNTSKAFLAMETQKLNERITTAKGEGTELYYRLQADGLLNINELQERSKYDEDFGQYQELRERVSKVVGVGLANHMPVETLREIEEMSGYKQTQFMELFLKQEAGNLAGYMNDSRSKPITLSPQAEAELIHLYPAYASVAGREWNIATDDKDIAGKSYTSALRARLNSQIRSNFFAQYDAIPNEAKAKFFFPEFKRLEQHYRAQDQHKETQLLQQDYENTATSHLLASLKLSSGGAAEEFVTQTKILGNVYGSRARAQNYLIRKVISDMEAGTVPVEDVEKMLDEEIIRDDGHRLTLRELLGPKLTALNYEARKVTGYKKAQNLRATQIANANDALLKNLIEGQHKGLTEGGQPLTNGDLAEISNIFYEEWGVRPTAIQTFLNSSEKDGIPIKEWLEYKRIKNGGTLSQADIKDIHPSLLTKYYQNNQIEEYAGQYAPNTEERADIKSIATAVARQRFQITGDDRLSPEANAFAQRAERHGIRIWTEARQGDANPAAAWEQVNDQLRARGSQEEGSYDVWLGREAAVEEVNLKRKAVDYLKKKEGNYESLIPGTENKINEIIEWNNRGGRDPIPSFYKYLASKGGVNAWDLMNAQSIAAGNGKIVEPKPVQDSKKLSLPLQRLQNFVPSVSKNLRVMKSSDIPVQVPNNSDSTDFTLNQPITDRDTIAAAGVAQAKQRSRSSGDWLTNSTIPTRKKTYWNPTDTLSKSWWNGPTALLTHFAGGTA